MSDTTQQFCRLAWHVTGDEGDTISQGIGDLHPLDRFDDLVTAANRHNKSVGARSHYVEIVPNAPSPQ